MSIGAYLSKFGEEIPDLEEDDGHQRWIKRIKKAVIVAVQKQTGTKPAWAEGKEPDEQIGKELGGGWNRPTPAIRRALVLYRQSAHGTGMR